jgi:hypothetical protein
MHKADESYVIRRDDYCPTSEKFHPNLTCHDAAVKKACGSLVVRV